MDWELTWRWPQAHTHTHTPHCTAWHTHEYTSVCYSHTETHTEHKHRIKLRNEVKHLLPPTGVACSWRLRTAACPAAEGPPETGRSRFPEGSSEPHRSRTQDQELCWCRDTPEHTTQGDHTHTKHTADISVCVVYFSALCSCAGRHGPYSEHAQLVL